jgi:hypothetical protein
MSQQKYTLAFAHVHLATTFSDDTHDLGVWNSRLHFKRSLVQCLVVCEQGMRA